MFDFEKLKVYHRAKSYHRRIKELIKAGCFGSVFSNQLSRASLSIALNIAEGSGRFSKADRRNFYVISRSSVFECVAILDILYDDGQIDKKTLNTLKGESEDLSKMLFVMIRNLQVKK